MKPINRIKLALSALLVIASLLSTSITTFAHESPSGTGKTLSAVLLGSPTQASGDPEYKYIPIRRYSS